MVGVKSITKSLTGPIFSKQFKSRKRQHVPTPETNTTFQQTRVLATAYILTVSTSWLSALLRVSLSIIRTCICSFSTATSFAEITDSVAASQQPVLQAQFCSAPEIHVGIRP